LAYVDDQANRHIAGVGSLFEHNIEAVLQLEIIDVVETGRVIVAGRSVYRQTHQHHQEK
jgi:hypothetical protein